MVISRSEEVTDNFSPSSFGQKNVDITWCTYFSKSNFLVRVMHYYGKKSDFCSYVLVHSVTLKLFLYTYQKLAYEMKTCCVYNTASVNLNLITNYFM